MIRPIRISNDVTEVWVSRQNSRLYRRLQRPHFASATQTFNEKSFSRRVFLVKSEKHLGNWSGIVSCIFLSMKRIVESRLHNSGEGNRTRHKRKLRFLSEILCHVFTYIQIGHLT